MKQEHVFSNAISGQNWWVEWDDKELKKYWYEPLVCFCVDSIKYDQQDTLIEIIRPITIDSDGLSGEVEIDSDRESAALRIFYCTEDLSRYTSDKRYGIE